MINMHTILVAIDLSDLSETVMDYARSLATVWKARLLVAHVVHDLSYFTGMYVTGVPLAEFQQRLEDEARERLDDLCQTTLADAVPYETLVRTGRPAIELNLIIREYEVDCLIIGAHSTDKPEHQLFGSTAQWILHQPTCPVFMIPPHRSSEFVSRG